MPTLFIRRVLFVVPDSRRAAFATWWVANIDAGGAITFNVPLSATGQLPVTHWAACAALTDAQFRLVVIRLCQLAAISFPGNWNLMTRAAKRDWVRSQVGPIWQAVGIGIRADDNDNGWDDYRAAVAAAGLQFIYPSST